MVTQRDIAQQLGISVMTVSRALAGKPHVSEARRREVQEAARQRGYVPNPLVQSLMRTRASGKKTQMGLVVAWLGAGFQNPEKRVPPVFSQYVKGADTLLRARGFHLEDFFGLYKKQGCDPRILKRILQSRGIPGVLLGPQEEGLRLEEMDWGPFAVLQIGHSRHLPGMGRVCTDPFGNMELCHTHLRRMGYRRIGFYESAANNLRNERLWEAAHRLHAPGIPPRLESTREAVCAKGLETYVASRRLDAVITARADLWHARKGKRKQLGLAFLLREGLPPEAPGVEVDHAAIAAAAADMLVGNILSGKKGLTPVGPTLSLPGRWVDRCVE